MNPRTAAPAGQTAEPPSNTLPPVPRWPLSRRARNAALRLFRVFYAVFIAASPNKPVAEHPVLRVLVGAFAAPYLVGAFGELRVRVLLEHDGLVVARFRRTRIPWADVSEVRVRGLSMGRGWVEVVRHNSREIVLPTPVEAYPLLKEQWERATAAGRAPGAIQGRADP